MSRTLVIVSTLSLLFVAAMAPVAFAKEPSTDSSDRPSKEDRPAKDGERPAFKEMKEMREKRAEQWKARFTLGNASLSLTGTATDKQNQTYSFALEGDGKVLERYKNGTMQSFRGAILVHGTVTDANGTVVKESDFRVKVSGHLNETGAWHYKVVSFAERKDMPRLLVRGEASDEGAGLFELEGKGRAIVRLANADEDVRPSLLKLSEIAGQLTVPVRAAAAA